MIDKVNIQQMKVKVDIILLPNDGIATLIRRCSKS
jgi:hypothetical protein